MKYLSSTLSIFLVLTFLLLSVNMASASISNLGTFKQNACINLLQTCADCTYNNISSVKLPDGVTALGLTSMTKSGTEFTYSFCNATQSGRYNVNGYGDAGGALTKWNYIFDVTPSGGAENNTTFFIILIVISVGLLLLGFIFHNYIFSFIAGLAFSITGVYAMIYGYGGVANLYTRMIAFIIIGLGMIITVVSGFELAGEAEGNNNTYNEEEEAGD